MHEGVFPFILELVYELLPNKAIKLLFVLVCCDKRVSVQADM